MSEAVLADAQFGVAKVLKPFAGFEEVYQGQAGSVPIAIPGDLDREAGREGFDENLIRGQAVPFGSKIVLWIPTILVPNTNTPSDFSYRIVWRLRNLRDFRQNRDAYHFPRQNIGQDNQFVIPASKKVLLFEGPTGISFGGQQCQTRMSFEAIEARASLFGAPLTPAGNVSALQQGLGEAAAPTDTATYNSIQLDSEGDEMIILVSKSPTSNWNFSDPFSGDKSFSDFYGSGTGSSFPDLGIYLFTGSNP